MYKHIDVEQNSDEWFKARLGKWTASFFSKAYTATGRAGTGADTVNAHLVAETIIGEPAEYFQSDDMARGNELEAEAVEFLNFTEGYNFEAVGFLDSGLGYGCSPDALDLDKQVGAEIKVPANHTHLQYLTRGILPLKYKVQVQGSMLVSGFKKWVFCSYSPNFQSLVIEVERDEAFIEKLKAALLKNCGKVEIDVAKLRDIL